MTVGSTSRASKTQYDTRRWSKRLGPPVLGSVLLVSAAFFFAPNLLRAEQSAPPGTPFDSIVVLGGYPSARAPHAAELFQSHLANRVLITGIGDCQSAKRLLLQHGVPELKIHLECDSETTRENAIFATRILHEQQAKRVILVTSWYHSRRALASFRHFAPDIEFVSMPSHENMTRWPRHWKGGAEDVLSEYVKLIGYTFRWGILPF